MSGDARPLLCWRRGPRGMKMRRALHIAGVVCAVFFCAGRVEAESRFERTQGFQQRVDEAARTLKTSPHWSDLPHERRRGIVEFFIGNMLFALLHEMGHTHISEMGLPVLGREEDAADSFAVVTILRIGSSFTRDILTQASLGWFLSAARDEKEGVGLTFYDVHALDRQRAYQIICLMVGSDQETFSDLANSVALPDERQSECKADFSNASWSWEMLLKPHLRAESQPRTTIEVTYGAAAWDLALFEKVFRAVRLLEIVADQKMDEFVWPRPFSLEMQSCGSSGAYWNRSTRKVTLCYEMAAEFAELYRNYGETIPMPRYR